MSSQWYKKQLDALKKKSEKQSEKPAVEPPKKPKIPPAAFPNPVAQRNKNRPKTDLY